MTSRIAVVIPWFGRALRGGAEEFAFQVATRLSSRGHAVEVLATCGASFQSDWSADHHAPGMRVEDGVAVRRFRVRRRDTAAFDEANRQLLAVPRGALRPGVAPVPAEVAETFVRENIHAPRLLEHLERRGADYRAVLFLPYLYGPTLLGVERVAERAWIQPCLHDEAYAYLPQVAAMVARARGLLFNSHGEAELAARLYGPAVWAKGVVVGGGIEVEVAEADAGVASRDLLARAGDRFVLYLGRRDPTKNVDLLLDAFARARTERGAAAPRLVLAGPGPAPAGVLPEGAIDLGLVDAPTKRALLDGCLALVQPSSNESYSRVMMEAWAAGRPVIVHRDCLATATAVAASGGGCIAGTPGEWSEALLRVADAASAERGAWGEAGRAYARDFSDWDRAIDRSERALVPVATAPARRAAPLRVAAIHQLLPTLAPGDAIGNHARHIRDWLRSRGVRSEIISIHCDPRLEHERLRFHPGVLRPSEGVIYHHSIGSEVTPEAVQHDGPKLLIHHNVTPPEFFAPYRSDFAPLLAAGREDLADLAAAFPHSVGDSSWNAEELAKAGFRDPGVLPITVEPRVWDELADPLWMERLQDGAPNLLFVGRIVPNKRQDHLIGLLAHLHAYEPRARLVLAGPETPGDPYASCLRLLATRLGVANRVVFAGELTPAALHACYRTAHLFVTLSEHEGFGVPLVEAMWFDVPVLAYRSTAVPETLGDAGVLVREKRWPELAALAARLLRDARLREAVVRAQRRRREAFRFAALEGRYTEWLQRAFGAEPTS